MTINIPGTHPIQVQPQPMMDHFCRTPEAKTEEKIKEFFNRNELKDIKNLISTDAGKTVINMVDINVKGEKCISAEKWNAFVAEKFPHVTAKPVRHHIDVIDAMKSLTTYMVKEQAAQQAELRKEYEAKGEKPKMGLEEEPQEAVYTQTTTQVDEDGVRHFYKKQSNEGEEGYKEIDEEEYRSLNS